MKIKAESVVLCTIYLFGALYLHFENGVEFLDPKDPGRFFILYLAPVVVIWVAIQSSYEKVSVAYWLKEFWKK